MSCFGVFAQARPTIVHVSIIDGLITTRAEVDAVDEFLKKNLPDHKFVSATVVAGKYKENPRAVAEVRDTLISKIKKDITNDDVVTHLIIDTHGTTFETATLGTLTQLQYVGEISTYAVDKDFEEIFAGIKNKMSDNAAVIFDSCSTMKGSEKNAAERAASVLKFFNVKNGTVYGATLRDVFVPGALNRNFKPREWLLNMHALKIMAPLTLLVAIGQEYLLRDPGQSFTFSVARHFSLQFVGLYIPSSLIVGISLAVGDMIGKINRGRLFISENGVISRIFSLRKYRDRFQVYGIESPRACENALDKIDQAQRSPQTFL